MTAAEDRAADIQRRMTADMRITLVTHLGPHVLDDDARTEALVHDLVMDGMFPVEQLLAEVPF